MKTFALILLGLTASVVAQSGTPVADYAEFVGYLEQGKRATISLDFTLCIVDPPTDPTQGFTLEVSVFEREQEGGTDQLEIDDTILLEDTVVSEITFDSSGFLSLTAYNVALPAYTTEVALTATCQVGNGVSLFVFGAEDAAESVSTFEEIKAGFLDTRQGSLQLDLSACAPGVGETAGVIAEDVRHSVGADGEVITLRVSHLHVEEDSAGNTFAFRQFSEAFMFPDDTVTLVGGGIDAGIETEIYENCPMASTIKVFANPDLPAPSQLGTFDDMQAAFLAGRKANVIFQTANCEQTGGEEILNGADYIVWRPISGMRWIGDNGSGQREFQSLNNYEFLSSRVNGVGSVLHEDLIIRDDNNAYIRLAVINGATGEEQAGDFTCPLGAGLFMSTAEEDGTPIGSFDAFYNAAVEGASNTVLIDFGQCTDASGNPGPGNIGASTLTKNRRLAGRTVQIFVDDVAFNRAAGAGYLTTTAIIGINENGDTTFEATILDANTWTEIEEVELTCPFSALTIFE